MASKHIVCALLAACVGLDTGSIYGGYQPAARAYQHMAKKFTAQTRKIRAMEHARKKNRAQHKCPKNFKIKGKK